MQAEQDKFTKLSLFCHRQACDLRGISNQKAGDFEITRFYSQMVVE